MNLIDVYKALANKTRLDILEWLREPRKHFKGYTLDYDVDQLGVCVGDLTKKSGLSQSTVSNYLKTLEKIDFLIATRDGQWTHYKRNEASLETFKSLINKHL